MKILQRAALAVFRGLEKRGLFANRTVERNLSFLNPSEKSRPLREAYYTGKIQKAILVFLAGMLFALLLHVKSVGEKELYEGNRLARGEINTSGQEIKVEAELNGETQNFVVSVAPRELTQAKQQEYYSLFAENAAELIRGKNDSCESVSENLSLESEYEGYPFGVEWKSDCPEIVDSAGNVRPGSEEQEVFLTATLSYMEQEWTLVQPVHVAAGQMTEEEKRTSKLEELIRERERSSREDDYMELPPEMDGQSIVWKKTVRDPFPILAGATFLVAVLLFVMADKDLQSEVDKQRESMKREYPDIVYKLALYIGAGMTLKGAFQKIGSEYEDRIRKNGPKSPIGEQILYTCRELKSGTSETIAYETFGKRTGVQEYIRLSTLMAQNLKKGSNSLLGRLKEEADRALDERIRLGRKLGEEASTKLLLPMVMMLGVVMVMVILPAFGTMGL